MKKIVIGIDISKEKIDASAIEVQNVLLSVRKLGYETFENRPMGFRRMLVWARHLIKGVGLEEVLFCCETTACATTSTLRTWTSGARVRFRSSAAWACERERTTRPTR